MNWEQQVKHALESSSEMQPQPAVVDLMCARVETIQRRKANVRFGIFCAALAGSTWLFAHFIQTTAVEAEQSGLIELISLLRTDSAIVLHNWYSFVLSIAEVVPAFSLVGVLCALLGMVVSAGYSAQTWYLTHSRISLSRT